MMFNILMVKVSIISYKINILRSYIIRRINIMRIKLLKNYIIRVYNIYNYKFTHSLFLIYS